MSGEGASIASEHAPAASLFDVEGLALAYPVRRGQAPVPVLTDVTFTVARTSALVLVGPSGSGKSTLLRCLNRLEEPTHGTVRFRGRDITLLDPLELRRRAALVLQTPVLFEGTVAENLRMHPHAVRVDLSPRRLEETLAAVGLAPDFLGRDALTLSGGEKQRVTIARALLGNPEALLLDEPTASLDPPNAALVVDTIAALRQSHGLTIVAATHQPELIRRLGGAVLYLVAGRVRAYERLNGDGQPLSDARIEAFLHGESPSGAR